MTKRNIYLVPGFFGFSSLGALNYFHGVREVLTEALDSHGIEADIIDCTTKPTASIRRRAEWLLQEICDKGALDADELHFVGHSTGGLDIRLLLTPGVRLREDDAEVEIAERAASCTTVSTPHFGTPLASFFNTLAGRHLLEILTLLATTRVGRYGLFGASRLAQVVSRLDDFVGLDNTFLDVWGERLLSRISLDKNDAIFQFFKDVSRDQGAIIQLTPESMNLFNAAVLDHADVYYSSVLTAAPNPLHAFRARDVLSPAKGASRGIFTLLYYLAAREHRHYPYPHPGDELLTMLNAMSPHELDAGSNDGIVPTLSQVYGKVVGLCSADHLDVVGQYDTGEAFSDWLPCGSNYSESDFKATWSWIAHSIAVGAGSAEELPSPDLPVSVGASSQESEETAARF